MTIVKKGDFNIDSRRLTKELKVLPRIIGNIASNHFQEGFRRGGKQTNKSLPGWKSRKAGRGRKARERSRGRAILVDTGALRNDIDVRRTSANRVVVGTQDVKYAEYHNEGTKNLPQREFIGDSDKLDKKVVKRIESAINKSLKI